MSLVLPKYVVMTNDKLKRLYHVLLFLTIAFMVFQFVHFDQHRMKLTMARKVQVSTWVVKPREQELEQVWRNAASSDVCRAPHLYDYAFDHELIYEGHTCLPVCGLHTLEGDENVNDEGGTCFPRPASYVQESQDQVFLVSRIEERVFQNNNSEVSRSQYVVPTVEAQSISINFGYAIERQKFWHTQEDTFYHSQEKDTDHSRSGGSLKIVVLDSNREITKTWHSGDALTFTVPELMSLTGFPNMLEAQQPKLGRNVLRGAARKDGPSGRISGIQLNLHIDCYDRPQMNEETESPVCYIQVEQDLVWAERRVIDISGRNTRDLRYSGIRINVSTGGSWSKIDFTSILLNVVAATVFLQFPKKIVLFFSLWCLGTLSEIYARFIFERVNIGEQIGSMVAKLLTDSSAFTALAQKDSALPEKDGEVFITQQALISLGEKLQSENVTTSSPLSKKSPQSTSIPQRYRTWLPPSRSESKLDVDAFMNIAWKTMCDPEWLQSFEDSARCVKYFNEIPCVGSLVEKLVNVVDFFTDDPVEALSTRHRIRSDSEYLHIDEFLRACSYTQPIGADALVEVFSDASPGFIERCFTPQYILDYREKTKNNDHSIKFGDITGIGCKSHTSVHNNLSQEAPERILEVATQDTNAPRTGFVQLQAESGTDHDEHATEINRLHQAKVDSGQMRSVIL